VGPQRLILLLALVLALATGCRENGSEQGNGRAPEAATAVVQRVNDGDTLTLRDGRKVRLLQIDAPELYRDCYGRAAQKALLRLAGKGTRVTLVRDARLDDRDRYGRMLRYVFAAGTNVNVVLVRRGAAAPYFFRDDRGRYADALIDAVDEARDARRGFWAACPGARLNPGIGSVTGPA
jgi:micrococcal nuclease